MKMMKVAQDICFQYVGGPDDGDHDWHYGGQEYDPQTLYTTTLVGRPYDVELTGEYVPEPMGQWGTVKLVWQGWKLP